MTFKRSILFTFIVSVILLPAYLWSKPPHPRLAYKWEVLPTSEVVLYYLVNGQHLRYAYKMVHEVEPAVGCTHKYGPKNFRLITFDTTMPYFYTMDYVPTMKWDALTKKYVRIE